MKWLADESLESAVVESLRASGLDVRAVAEIMRGAVDPEVLQCATDEERILITYDKDFAELAFFQHHAAYGIVLARFPRLKTPARAARLVAVLAGDTEAFVGAMTVVDESAMRRRQFPALPARGVPKEDS